MAQIVKCLPAMQKTWGSIPGLGKSPEEGNGNPLQYSCLEKSHGQQSLVGYSPWGCRVGHNFTYTFKDAKKSRDIALLTKVHLVKAMVFPVVMYGYES